MFSVAATIAKAPYAIYTAMRFASWSCGSP